MRYSWFDWYRSSAPIMIGVMSIMAVVSLFWYWAGAVAIGLFLLNLIETRLTYNSHKRKVEENPDWFFDKWGE